MTISSTTNRNDYTGNDTTATYNYTYRIFLDTDLLLTVKDTATNVETTLVKGTDYSVTGVGDGSGGTIVLIDAGQAWISASSFLDTGYSLTIRRVVNLTQLTDIRNQGDFFPEVHEDEFDKSRMIDQQQQDELDRSIKLPESVDPATFDPTMPTPVAENFIVINAAGDGFDLSQGSAENLKDANIAADADITRTKLAPGTADYVLINDGSGEFSEEQYLAKSRGGTGADNSSVTFPASGTITENAAAQTLTNKTIDGDNNTISNLAHGAEVDDPSSGVHGVTGSVVGTSDTQDLSNKTFTDGVILQEIAAPSSPPAGDQHVYIDSTTKKLTRKDSSGNVYEIGSGGGGLDVFHTQDCETLTAVSASGSNSSFLGGGSLDGAYSQETTSEISGLVSGKYTASTASNNDYLEIETINLDLKQRNQFIKCRMIADMSGFANDVTFVIYDKTNAALLTTSVDVLTASEARSFYEFAVFVPSNCAQISWGFHMNNGATNTESFLFDDIEFSTNPFILADLSEMSDWTAYTPTLTGFGTVAGNEAFYKRVGDMLVVQGRFQSGTSTAVEGKISIPANITIDQNKLHSTNNMNVGSWMLGNISSTGHGGAMLTATTDSTTIGFGSLSTFGSTSVDALVKVNGSAMIASTEVCSYEFRLPITEWASSSTSVITPAKSTLTNWVSYTPTFQGFGTVSGLDAEWRRVGENIQVRGKVITGTPTAAEAQISLPNSLTVGGNVASVIIPSGEFIRHVSGDLTLHFLATKGDAFVNLGYSNRTASTAQQTPQNGSVILGTSDTCSFSFEVPIAEWTSDATFLAAIPLDESQTKVLSANVTTDTTVSDLTFNNLVVGESYNIKGHIRIQIIGALGCDIDIKNGSTLLGIVTYVNPGAGPSGEQSCYPNIDFVADSTTVTVTTVSMSANEILRGNGTRRETFLQLKRLAYHKETTRY